MYVRTQALLLNSEEMVCLSISYLFLECACFYSLIVQCAFSLLPVAFVFMNVQITHIFSLPFTVIVPSTNPFSSDLPLYVLPVPSK